MGILFKRHTMNYPNDERTLACSIYREDMLPLLMHGDEIKTFSSAGSIWKHDETIRLSEISWWKGKIVYDYNYTLEIPLLSEVSVSPDNKFFRFDISYGAHEQLKLEPFKFLQFVAPTDCIKRFFHLPINLNAKARAIVHLITLNNYDITKVISFKVISNDVLKHGKVGDGLVFEPHLGFNAFVDLELFVPKPPDIIANRPFHIKVRVFLKTIDGLIKTDDTSIIQAAKLLLDSTALDMKEYFVSVFGNSYFIP